MFQCTLQTLYSHQRLQPRAKRCMSLYTDIAMDEVDKFLVDFSFNDLKLDIMVDIN